MSRCLNKATLIGYLGADPEIRTISSGAVTSAGMVRTARKLFDGHVFPGPPRSPTA